MESYDAVEREIQMEFHFFQSFLHASFFWSHKS